MIKPEQVPDDVFVAFQNAWADPSTLSTKECLAAALNAWPGMREQKQGPFGVTYDIILPLTQKQEDGDA